MTLSVLLCGSFLLCFGTLFSFFIYLFIPLFLGFCPSSSGLRLCLVTTVRVPLLLVGVRFIFSVIFPSLLLWYARSSCFPRHFWVLIPFVGLLPAVPARAPSFLCPLVFALPHAAFRPWSLRSFSAILSLLCLSQFSMVFVPVFPIPTPPSALRFDTPPVLSVLRVLLGNPSVVRLLLPCISASFLLYSGHSLLRVLPCPSGCLSVLRDCFSSCLLWFSTWSPFGTSPDSFDLCFLGSSCLPLLVSFLFVYTPFLCLVRSWRSLRVVFTRWVQLVFSWCLVSFGVGSFLGCFWFLPVRVAFTLLLLPLVFFGLRFPSRWGLPLGWVPGFSRYFSLFFFFFFFFNVS